MARLSALSLPDPLALWGRALWKAAAPCVAIMVIVGVWSLVTPSATPSSEVNLSAELEQAVYASLESQVGVSVNW